MKKIFIFYFLLSVFCFSKGFESINSLEAKVEEKTFINGQWKTKLYNFRMKYPNCVFKETLEPELNKGEKVLYKEGKKYIYYPIFDEVFDEEIDGEENYILSSIKLIKEKKEKEKIFELVLESGISLFFYDYVSYNDVYFPKKVEAYDQGEKISEIYFENVIINKKYEENDFEIISQ